MRLPRFSIASGLTLIAILAVALAALRNPSYLWANVTYSLALGAVVVAFVNAVYSREAGRAYWLGFSLCGGIYLTVCSVPVLRDSVCSRLLTETILDFLYPHLSPASSTPSSSTVASTSGGGSLPELVVSTPFPKSGPTFVAVPQPPVLPRWAEWTEPDRMISSRIQFATVALHSSEAYREIGHSMFTLLLGVLGANFARHRYRIIVGERPGSQPAA